MGISGSLDISPQTGDSGLDYEQYIDHHSDTDCPCKHLVILIFLPFPIQTYPNHPPGMPEMMRTLWA